MYYEGNLPNLKNSKHKNQENQGRLTQLNSNNNLSKDRGFSNSERKNDYIIEGSITTRCAFHKGQKITNFCKSKDCLLPLCPKCVKIHADEHIKMSVFGEFDTIQGVAREAQQGLRNSFVKSQKLLKFMIYIKDAYQSKINSERKRIREARNIFIEEIQKIFDLYENAMLSSSMTQNREFVEQLYNTESQLSLMIESSQHSLQKLATSQNTMEGIINYYTNIQGKASVEDIEKKLNNLFPRQINFSYNEEQLQRLEHIVKRYLDFGSQNYQIGNKIKCVEGDTKTKHNQQTPNYKGVSERSKQNNIHTQTKKIKPSLQSDQRYDSPNINISNIDIQSNKVDYNYETNLSLNKFKSPLQNFSLIKNRLRNQK